MEVSLPSFRKRFTYDPQKDLLGKGGFGEVYKAYDNEDQHYVALKISQGTADNKYNLITEIKRFKKLNHPNIVKHIEAYEVNAGSTDIHGNPILYHVGILEYADSGTFADLLKKGTPDYRVIETLAKDIIEGLAYLHKEGIIHRDLKPTNILLFNEGEKLRAKITDFGIAKNTNATTASTQLVGTVEYMAPEYFTTGDITPASDVWSLGVMLLEALTGTHPFGKTSQGLSNEQIIANILNKDISTATANLTEPLKKIVTDCLRRKVDLRAQSAEVFTTSFLNPTNNPFEEQTQVIETKKKEASSQSKKPKSKRLWNALFNFELSNGKWRKFIAKELMVLLASSIISLLLPFLLSTILYSVSLVKKNKIESELKIINPQIDSLKSMIDSPFKFSDSYFGWHQKDSSRLYTDLGGVYDELCYWIAIDKLNFDSELSDIRQYRSVSYFSFAQYARSKLKNNDQIWLVKLQTVLRDHDDNWENFNLVSAIESVNNLSLDMPQGGGDNTSLFPDYIFEPSYFIEEISKRIKIEGWVDWFFEYRVNKNPLFIKYLQTKEVKNISEFVSLFEKVFECNRLEERKKKLQYELQYKLQYELRKTENFWGMNTIGDNEIELFPFLFFYPFRFTIAIILWSIKTLRSN
ncbi:MAG: serine/threonine protein kinase [Chitinophagales bacterium]|nr:serine/threonine protein kinase [Chitinophagales bacterium]